MIKLFPFLKTINDEEVTIEKIEESEILIPIEIKVENSEEVGSDLVFKSINHVKSVY